MTPSLSKDIRGVTYDHTILNSIVQRVREREGEGEIDEGEGGGERVR